MADTKVSALTEDTAPLSTDLLYEVDDPAGTPLSKKTTIGNVVGYVVTTAGDIIIATASRTLARLGIGTAGQVLAVNSGATAPEWVNPSASGVRILKAMPPATLAATIDYRAGGSTPAEQFMVWDFDPSTAEYMDFLCRLENYNGGGLTFTIAWSADGTAAGNVVWEIAIRAIPNDTEDVDTSHTYLYNQVIDAAPTVDGEVTYATITFTDGADMDSWADGELGIARVRRLATDGSDTMNSNDAELWSIRGIET